MRRDIHRRSVTMVAVLVAAGGVGAGGCGGSDTPAVDPADAFVGRWRIELAPTDTSAFRVMCPVTFNGPYAQWFDLNFERGVLGDLYETSQINDPSQFGCLPLGGDPAFSYRVAGNTATIINPDPITGTAPTCEAPVFNRDGDVVALFDFFPGPDWSFTLAAPEGGVVKHGFLKGSATVIPTTLDPVLNTPVTGADCTYISSPAGDPFERITQP